MSEGKKNIMVGLIQEYYINSAEDIQEALKDLLGGTIQKMGTLDASHMDEVDRALAVSFGLNAKD